MYVLYKKRLITPHLAKPLDLFLFATLAFSLPLHCKLVICRFFHRVLAQQLAVALLVVVLATSCSSITSYTDFNRRHVSRDVRKVAVFPFRNESGRTGAGEIVTNIFTAVLFNAGMFQVEEKGNIERFLIRNKLKALKKVDIKQLKRLGEKLNIDAVFFGIVEEFSGGDEGRGSTSPIVSIRMRLVDIETGKVLWMVHHRKNGRDYIKAFEFGIIRSVSSLAKQVAQEVVDTIL